MAVRRYAPGLNGSAFIGMCEVPGPGFSKSATFVESADYDELKRLYDDCVARYCELRQKKLADVLPFERVPHHRLDPGRGPVPPLSIECEHGVAAAFICPHPECNTPAETPAGTVAREEK